MSAQPSVQSLIDEINQRVQDKILEQSNANLLISPKFEFSKLTVI